MITLETSISRVTVYPDRARVMRRGTVAIESGTQTLVIDDLPAQLDPDSVRAAARGTARLRLLGVSVERVYYRESPAERVQELEREILALADQDTAHGNLETVLQEQLKHLNGLAGQTEVFARGLAFGRTQVSDQVSLLDFLSERSKELRQQLLDLQITRRELAKTLQKLQQELKRLQSARPRQRMQARIELEVAEAGDLEADLIYTLRGAGWQPLYDLRFWEATEERPRAALELTYLAQVRQETGEDWQNVALVLSTARPAVSGVLPELDPWYLDVYAPPPPPAARAKLARMADMERVGAVPEAEPAMMLAAAPAPMVEAEAAVATVDTSGTAVSFQVASPVTIPADGEPHKTTVTRYDLEPKLDYLAAPKLVDAVYRRALVTNTSEAVFLPGHANVFSGEEFIGGTELELIAPGQEFEVALGVDDRIRIERELVARDVDKTIIGDRRRLHYGYQIEVENLRPVAETITVRDHYPLPRNEQIKVKLDSAAPPATEEAKLHLLEWRVELPAGAKKTIRFDVTIDHPRSIRVTGLQD